METEAQFASLDAAALYGEENEFQPDRNALARRSISIFSRRGTETPEPRPPFFAQAAMHLPKQMTEKQKSWIKRKSCPASASASTSTSPKKPKATILNAVPRTKAIKMTPLEEEIATSPNEEILSAVSASPTQTAFKVSLTQQTSSFWNKSNTSLTQRTASQTRRDTSTRIGVWVDGIAHWDDQAVVDRVGWDGGPSLLEGTGFTPLNPIPANGLNASASTRPILSVVVPSTEPLINDTTISTIVQPMPQRPVVSVAPASIVSKFASSTPTITVDEPYDVSPVESISRQATPPPHEQSVVAQAGPTNKQKRTSRSSSSSSWADGDDSSQYSQRSSATSVEPVAVSPTPEQGKAVLGDAGKARPDFDKPLPPRPMPPPRRKAPTPPTLLAFVEPHIDGIHARSSSVKSAPGGRTDGMLLPIRPLRTSRSLSQLDLVDREFMRSAPKFLKVNEPESPTLSQAEDDLKAHLSTIAEDSSAIEEEDMLDNMSTVAKSGSVRRSDSVHSVMQPPERAPTIPKRSRKREWRTACSARRTVQFSHSSLARRRRSESNLQRIEKEEARPDPVPTLRKSTSAAELSKSNRLSLILQASAEEPMPPPPRIIIDDGLIVVHGPITLGEEDGQQASVSSASAEDVLLHILAELDDIRDLFNTALINKGMYRVYKENEMHLIRMVSYNSSPAAWEFSEWCPPGRDNEIESDKASSQLENTPKSYMRSYRRDMDVIESLKSTILEHCQTFIRRETAFALSTPTHPNARRFNDAFWRIWCFCKIFGCGKGREEDITGQLDWLKGGVLANNEDLTATMNMNLEFDISSVLLNAPEHFAKGNSGGLSAQQLYDMMEIWNCLVTVIEGFQGRADQARRNGVFDDCEIFDGDGETEEQVLEEWTAYLLTLGPSVVLDMAKFAFDSSPAGFALARVSGWTQWNPTQSGGGRSTFLKEPVSRLYEERVAAAALKLHNPREREMKELSRKRVANLAAEIRVARQASSYKRRPFIDQSMERQMSVLSRRGSAASTYSLWAQTSITAKRASSPTQRNRPPNFSVPRPRSPSLSLWSARKISPIIEERVDVYNRISLQNFAGGVAEDTSDLAVRRITSMGFSTIQARESLRMTDMGDGLRVDRAVDLLLRQQQ